ncbi:hypothetical protein ABPG75_004006 [Micractinium tetrahymenae]
MKGQSPGDWRPPPCSWNSQLGGRPAPSAATGPPFCAGAATPTASQASHASQLTAAQRARAEANRQEALRRRAEAGQRKQQGVGPGPAGLQAPPRPAPSSSAGWGLPSAAVAMPDTATSRPPSALRGLFAIPTSLQQSQHPQQYSAGPAGAPQHQHPGPAPRSQLPPQPGSALAAIFGSGRPQSAGFSFQPPPGLAPASEVAHIADEGRQQEQSALVPDAGTYARKHLAGAVPTWPSAQANGSGHGGRWTPGSAATPTAGRSGEPASEKERRLRLQRLLCDVRDPFEPASTGGRWDWLREPRDAEGQPRSHPDHDPTTLHIPPSAFGTDLTGAHAQYWRIKAAGLAHCVLFFQEGNFYHLKDTDADIGMRVGLSAMGGARGSAANMWTVGCNTSAFNEWAAKVLALGYPVARVGECKRGTREPGSTLVKRTLRQVYTPGTLLDGTMADTCGGSQPLVTLWEGEHLRFGACVVDVQTATVSFTSWQEADTQRSMLQALLLQTDPAEVGFARGQLSADTRKLLRQELAPGGRSGRPVALTPIPHLLPCNPEDPAVAEELLDHTADMFATHRGKPAAFAAARPQLSPHAAAALQLAIHHLLAAQAAQHVLPPCSLVCGDGLLGAARGSGYMLLDACALRSLELLSNSEGGLPGSLLHLLNGAASAAGRRKARQFISNPLYRVGDIEERLATTELFMKHGEAADAFQAGLHRAPDCDRLLAKAANVLAAVVDRHGQQGGAAGRWAGSSHGPPAADARQQAPAAGQVAQLAAVLDLSQATFAPVVALFEGVGMLLQALHGLRCAMTAARGSQAPLPPPLQRASMAGEEVAGALQQLSQVFDAERFNDAAADIGLEQGLCAEYDAARASQEQLQAQVAGAVESIRQGLAGRGHGAAALKRVKLVDFRGQQLLEVPTAVRRDLEGLAQVVLVKEAQTIAKYRLPALETTLQALEEARDAAKLCVLRFLAESTQLFLDSYDSFRRLLNALSTLDVLAGFAAATHPSAAPPGCSFCRPSFVPGAAAAGEAPPLHLEGLWSPALLASQGVQRIQPNSLSLGGFGSGQGTQAPQPGMLLLTGANTGGKSTLLRAACLAAVMAQVGCYVPCSQAELAPVDRIYTRIGAQDRIFSGESTFAVEMLETSSLLRHATPASLVVLDELGRGTSTHDGHAIAHGVARWLAGTKRCRCLFATHFHALCRQPELTALAQVAHMQSAAAPGSGLTPFYRLAPGPAPQGSCGINVAASCGLPPSVVARAAQVARQQEEQAGERSAGSPASAGAAAGSPPRLPLQPLNQPSPGRPGAKRQRRMEQQQQEEGPSLQAAIAGEAANDLAEEQQEALAAVRLAVQALLAGAPGAVQQLLRLQAEVAAALATGEL